MCRFVQNYMLFWLPLLYKNSLSFKGFTINNLTLIWVYNFRLMEGEFNFRALHDRQNDYLLHILRIYLIFFYRTSNLNSRRKT